MTDDELSATIHLAEAVQQSLRGAEGSDQLISAKRQIGRTLEHLHAEAQIRKEEEAASI